MKYCVTIAKYGYMFVEAKSEEDAMNIADRQPVDTVTWSDDWCPTDASPNEDYNGEYITKPAF